MRAALGTLIAINLTFYASPIGCYFSPTGEAMSGDCAQCHMVDGDGIVPPGDHWEGESVSVEHNVCTECHSAH